MSARKTASNTMGNWKTNSGPLKWKEGKARPAKPSRTRPPGFVKIYRPNVPVGGWPGGDPEKNGYRVAKG